MIMEKTVHPKNNVFSSYYDNHATLHVMWKCHMAQHSEYIRSGSLQIAEV